MINKCYRKLKNLSKNELGAGLICITRRVETKNIVKPARTLVGCRLLGVSSNPQPLTTPDKAVSI